MVGASSRAWMAGDGMELGDEEPTEPSSGRAPAGEKLFLSVLHLVGTGATAQRSRAVEAGRAARRRAEHEVVQPRAHRRRHVETAAAEVGCPRLGRGRRRVG